MPDLKPREQKLVAALLTTRSVRAAATQSGYSERQAWRLLHEDGPVVAEYRARAKAALVAAETAVRAAAEDAVSVVADLMRDADTDAVRLRAALSVLEIARNVSVEELEERIEALEQGAR